MRGCEVDDNACKGNGGGVVALSVGHVYMGRTHGSLIVSRASDVLGMSVVRGMRGVDGVFDICMCLARGGK